MIVDRTILAFSTLDHADVSAFEQISYTHSDVTRRATFSGIEISPAHPRRTVVTRCRQSALHDTTVQLVFLLRGTVSMAVRLAGSKTITHFGPFSGPADGSIVRHECTVDLSAADGAAAEVTLLTTFAFSDAAGWVAVPTGTIEADALQSRAIGRIGPMRLGLLVWSTVATALVVFLGAYRYTLLENSFTREYSEFAVLVTAGTATLAIVIVPQVRALLRRLLGALFYTVVKRLLVPVTAIASVACLLLWTVSATPLSCDVRVHAYRVLIDDYLNNYNDKSHLDSLLDAFEMFPTRPEVMTLLASRAWDLRASSRSEFHAEARRLFADDGKIISVIRDLIAGKQIGQDCLSPVDTWPLSLRFNPIVWAITTIPEGDDTIGGPYTKKAIAYADTLTPPTSLSRLLNARMRIEAEEAQTSTAANPTGTSPSFDELVKIFDENRADFQYTHLFQEAIDSIGQHHLWRCDKKRALLWFATLMEIRKPFATTPARWLRPPDKLALFNFVRATWAPEPVLYSERFQVAWEQADKLSTRCRRAMSLADLTTLFQGEGPLSLADIKQLFQDGYPEWAKPDERAWYAGTVMALNHAELRRHVEDSIKQLWRFQ